MSRKAVLTTFQGNLLKTVREAMGHSQKGFAEIIGTTQATLSKWEEGFSHPSVDAVSVIVENTGFTESFYTTPRPPLAPVAMFRKLARTSVKNTTKYTSRAFLRAYLVEEWASKNPGHRCDLLEIMEKDPKSAAKKVREILGNTSEPLLNLAKTLQEHGLFIFSEDFDGTDIDGISIMANGAIPTITVSKNAPPDRFRANLAHELGHVILHRDLVEGEDPEGEAWTFAANLLMPEAILPGLRAAGTSLRAYLALKQQWQVSMAFLMRQAKKMGYIKDGVHRSLMIAMAPYRKVEPGNLPQDDVLGHNEIVEIAKDFLSEAEVNSLFG